MPVNSSRRLRDSITWAKAIENMKAEGKVELPPYFPGFLMFPDPSVGPISGYIDIAFWATFMYPFSSLVYVIGAGFSLDTRLVDDDGAHPSLTHPPIALNLLGAILLLFDALLCFWDWHLQRTQGALTLLNSDVQVMQQEIILVSELPKKVSNYYFINNIFFLFAAIIYLAQAIWMEDYRSDLTDCANNDWCGTFWINFWGASGYCT